MIGDIKDKDNVKAKSKKRKTSSDKIRIGKKSSVLTNQVNLNI